MSKGSERTRPCIVSGPVGYMIGYDENKIKARPGNRTSINRNLRFRVLHYKYSEVSDLALPGAGLLETVPAHTVIHDCLLDFITSGHDEWAILVNGLIERFSGDLIRTRQFDHDMEVVR